MQIEHPYNYNRGFKNDIFLKSNTSPSYTPFRSSNYKIKWKNNQKQIYPFKRQASIQYPQKTHHQFCQQSISTKNKQITKDQRIKQKIKEKIKKFINKNKGQKENKQQSYQRKEDKKPCSSVLKREKIQCFTEKAKECYFMRTNVQNQNSHKYLEDLRQLTSLSISNHPRPLSTQKTIMHKKYCSKTGKNTPKLLEQNIQNRSQFYISNVSEEKKMIRRTISTRNVIFKSLYQKKKQKEPNLNLNLASKIQVVGISKVKFGSEGQLEPWSNSSRRL